MAKEKILVSAFQAFGGQKINPSQMVLEQIDSFGGQVDKILLPVEFGTAFKVLEQKWQQDHWSHLLMLGQAAGRSKISLERVGLNWQESSVSDEAGWKPKPGPIDSQAVPAIINESLNLNLPTDLSSEAPVEWSFSAGTFVCNDLYFRALKAWGHSQKILFIHLPALPEQVKPGEPSMSLAKMLASITKYIQLCKASQA